MTVEALEKCLRELSAGYARNFDPIRFAYIQSLSNRLSRSRHTINAQLIEKANISAKQYRLDLNERRRQAQSVIDDIQLKFSDQVEAAQALFERCEFAELDRLHVRLNWQRAQQESLALIAELNQELTARASVDDQVRALSLDELLHQQEQEVRSATGHASPGLNEGQGEQLELHSMRYFRESMKHFSVDQMISNAINNGPENPGPHNPQMLATKALCHLRNLSPSYLRRLAAYIETALWVEKNTSKLSNHKKPL